MMTAIELRIDPRGRPVGNSQVRRLLPHRTRWMVGPFILDHETSATLSGAGKAIVLGGEPVGPRHIWWNFAHADPDRIEQAKDDWTRQRFPTVPGDHHPYVPLPEPRPR